MFGYRGGESHETVERKRGYRTEAQARWPFMTRYDLSTIHTPGQLSQMVHVRTGVDQAKAAADVAEWVSGKTF